MLTRLKIQGFKNLLDLEVTFGPFTCIAGENGVGKSNLFDAIQFLHLLTMMPIMEAVKGIREAKGRGPDASSLFTSFGAFRAEEIRFVADMVVERKVQDDFGVAAEAQRSTLRYTVAFELQQENGSERLVLREESLLGIKVEDARRDLPFDSTARFRNSVLTAKSGGSKKFISTEGAEIKVHQEGHGGRRVPAPKSQLTVIGGMASSDFPTILSVHREMAAWQTLMLEPSAMRSPSHYGDPAFIDTRGGNLPKVIDRLRRAEDERGAVMAEIANRLATLIDDVKEVRLREDELSQTITLEARGSDGVFHPARALSDGTLRFLVLSTLSMDAEARGVVCVEEPENGIHPRRVPAMVKLLRDIALDPEEPVGNDNPLRQVMAATHSPAVMRNLSADEVVYMSEAKVIRNRDVGTVADARVHPRSRRARKQTTIGRLGAGQLQPYKEPPAGNQPSLFDEDVSLDAQTRRRALTPQA